MDLEQIIGSLSEHIVWLTLAGVILWAISLVVIFRRLTGNARYFGIIIATQVAILVGIALGNLTHSTHESREEGRYKANRRMFWDCYHYGDEEPWE